MLTCCQLSARGMEVAAAAKAKAVGWLEKHACEFGLPAAEWALAALHGDVGRLDTFQRYNALRFILGMADNPSDPRDAQLAAAYGRGFLRPVATVLREARGAAVRATRGWASGSEVSRLHWRAPPPGS